MLGDDQEPRKVWPKFGRVTAGPKIAFSPSPGKPHYLLRARTWLAISTRQSPRSAPGLADVHQCLGRPHDTASSQQLLIHSASQPRWVQPSVKPWYEPSTHPYRSAPVCPMFITAQAEHTTALISRGIPIHSARQPRTCAAKRVALLRSQRSPAPLHPRVPQWGMGSSGLVPSAYKEQLWGCQASLNPGAGPAAAPRSPTHGNRPTTPHPLTNIFHTSAALYLFSYLLTLISSMLEWRCTERVTWLA